MVLIVLCVPSSLIIYNPLQITRETEETIQWEGLNAYYHTT